MNETMATRGLEKIAVPERSEADRAIDGIKAALDRLEALGRQAIALSELPPVRLDASHFKSVGENTLAVIGKFEGLLELLRDTYDKIDFTEGKEK